MLYHHIKKVIFIKIMVDKSTFNKIFYGKIKGIFLERTEQNDIHKNEFIRFISDDWYMDCTIDNILVEQHIIIYIKDRVDFFRPDKIKRKFKK